MGDGPVINGLVMRRVTDRTPDDWQLLLLADPNRDLVERYIEHGQCFRATANGEVAAFAVMLERDDTTVELMNIAVDPARQGQGIGTAPLHYAMDSARNGGYTTMAVGTGNWPVDNLAFYQKAGFRMVRIDRDYFTRHYPEPIIENGVCCRDRIDLHCNLTVDPNA